MNGYHELLNPGGIIMGSILKSTGITALIVLTLTAPAFALDCEVSEKYQCQPGVGCQPIKITTFAKIDLPAEKYGRCARNGCDIYKTVNSTYGLWSVIDVTSRGMLDKLA